jgi:hyperosmotically inducible periplasmic protein
MTNTVQRAIALLGAALMATQLIGAPHQSSPPYQGSSSAFQQAAPLTPAQKEVEGLLKQISANAAIASRHAETLEPYTRAGSRLQYESHAAEVNRAREAINSMGSDFRRLQELRPSALPWQQALMDRIGPVLAGLASHTTEAIERLSADRGQLTTPEYRDAVLNMYAHAAQARNLIAVNLDYAQAREKLNRLDETTAQAMAARESEGSPSKAPRGLEQRVRAELLKLPYYGVFDHLAFQIDGDRVTLSGDVTWPVLKTDAERAVKRIEGVAAVSNNIKVLPLSPNDDRIRLAAYGAIYGHSTLALYRLNPHPPIRIIVENGNVTLKGVVASELDRTMAHMQANSVPGAFSVTNNLQVGS